MNRALKRFNEFESEHSLSEQLPYWDFIEDVCVLADGSLCAAFALQGLAIETWDVERINRMTEQARACLNGLNDGTEISFVIKTDSDFSDVINAHADFKGGSKNIQWIAEARIAALRDQQGRSALQRSQLYLFIYERAKASSLDKKASFFASLFRAPKHFESVKRDVFEKMKLSLEQASTAFVESLSQAGLQAKRLTADEIRNLVYGLLNPSRSLEHALPPANVEYRAQEFSVGELAIEPDLQLSTAREQLAFSDVVQGMESLYFDGFHHRVVTLKTMPETTHAGMMSRLANLPFHYWLDVHIRVPEQNAELSSLQSKRRMAHSMAAQTGGRASDLETEAQLHSTEELLRELIQTGQKIFYFQTAILLRAQKRDELEMMTKTVLNKFRELSGAEGLAESVAGLKVLKTILPAGNITSVRAKRVKTDNLADFLPIYQPYSGLAEKPVCVFHNRQGGLVKIDPFDSKNLVNFNSLVTGSSGAGKSFMQNLFTLQSANRGDGRGGGSEMTFIIDIGGSYRKLCEFMGGQYIEISPPKDGEIRRAINPFELESNETEPSPQKIKFLLALLETMFTDTDADRLSKLSKSYLEEAIIETYALARKQGRVPLMRDLRKHLEVSSSPDVRDFAKMLYTWTEDRPYGKVLDRENELDLKSDFVVFDLKSLSSYPDLQAVMVLIITDFIIGKVEGGAAIYRGKRKRILMDECWELLKRKGIAGIMEYWVRTLRKSLSGITFVTQGLAEITSHDIASAILGNTATKIILMQTSDLALVRDTLKLNDQEMALISSLKQKKGVYSEAFMLSGNDRAVIRAMPTPLEYWLATSDANDKVIYEGLRSERPELSINAVIYELAKKYPRGVAA